jgi:ribosome-associated protein
MTAPTRTMESEQFARFVTAALDDLKAVNTVTLDVRGLTDLMDYLVLTSGTSNRHVKSLANHVSVEAKKHGISALGTEGETAGEWVLVDFGDVVVHVMLPATRDFYDLERLWTKSDVAT